MSERAISMHKRLAMGDRIDHKAAGGMVTPYAPRAPKVMAAKPAAKIPGMPMNPVTKMKMQNGVPGMRKGGKC